MRQTVIPVLLLSLAASSSSAAASVAANAGTLRLHALRSPVPAGTATLLRWSAPGARRCIASGAWHGLKPASGYEVTTKLFARRTFELVCEGDGWRERAQAVVTVLPVRPARTSLSLTASARSARPGGHAMLSWASESAIECHASGAWRGPRALQGTERSAPIAKDSTFTLTCTGEHATAISAVRVAVRAASLSWTTPTAYDDGSPLRSLAAFRLHFGPASRRYDRTLTVAAATTAAQVRLDPGSHYFAVTAVDGQGRESAYSNEVARHIP